MSMLNISKLVFDIGNINRYVILVYRFRAVHNRIP